MDDPLYTCTFTPDGWQPNDWLQVRGPRWDHPGGWEQQPDHISNCVPPGATKEEMQGPRAGEVYSSMIVDSPPVSDLLVRTRTSFDFLMAPLVVLTGPLGEDGDGNPEYREHIEVVIYHLGVNAGTIPGSTGGRHGTEPAGAIFRCRRECPTCPNSRRLERNSSCE